MTEERTDADLWSIFHSCELPEKEWNHRAHLRIAWMMLSRYPIEEAHVLMRVGIIRLNAAQGLVETKDRGYHETLTRFWLEAVAAVHRPGDTRVLVTEAGAALAKDAPLRVYTRERIQSIEARARYLDPDRLPRETPIPD